MDFVYFAVVVAFACFVQAVAGFGLPMIAMPLLVALFGIRVSVPLVAIIIFELQLLMIARYRMSLNLQTVWRLSVAAVLGIPIGVLFLSRIPEAITVSLLGLIIIFYVIYSLSNLPIPGLESPKWAYLFGFLSGIGSGAYNIGAPPMIVYGDTQRWEPKLFKGNLQGCFFVMSIAAILTHTVSGNVTTDILKNALFAVPFVITGAFAGFSLDRFINPARFRKIVLGLLLILGINLAVSWWR
ncbi:MAG: sulfite exporter TauE/SafE family protein [Candidatus Promineifilaceae bacterium]|nr:sulfite exporter TauE/SafE family protein [Candidatus Promineifilaceae bacterium]